MSRETKRNLSRVRAAAVVLAEVKEVRSFCQKSAWLEDDAEDTIAYLVE